MNEIPRQQQPASATSSAAGGHQRTDDKLREDVYRAISSVQPVRFFDVLTLRVEAHEGTARIIGNVVRSGDVERIRHCAERVAGVKAVVAEVADDESLAQAAGQALAAEPTLSGTRHHVYVVFGTVYLDWAERDARREQIARDVLLALPGVRAVVHGEWSRQPARAGQVRSSIWPTSAGC